MTRGSRARVLELATGRRLSGIRWTLADQATVSSANFLTIYLLARFMETGDFGLYMIGWISLLFLVSLQSAVITEPHSVFGPKRDSVGYRRLTTVLGVALLTGALALGLLLMVAGALLWTLASARYGQLLMVLGIVVVPWMAQEFVRRALYTRSETRAACANDAVSYGLQATGIGLVVLLARSPAPVAAFGVLGLSSLIAAVLGAWQLRAHLGLAGLTPQIARETWNEAASFGKWLLARNLVAWSGQYGHSWLLLAMLGPVALGTYKAAEHLLNLVNPIRLAACVYLPPHASRVHAEGGMEALRQWMRGVYRTAGGGIAIVILVLMVFSVPLLDLAYGDKFGSLPLEWILVFGGIATLVNFAALPLQMGIAAMQESRPLFWIHVWSVPLMLVTGTILIRSFGIFGVPVSSIVIGSVVLGLTLRAFHEVAVRQGAGVPAAPGYPSVSSGRKNGADLTSTGSPGRAPMTPLQALTPVGED